VKNGDIWVKKRRGFQDLWDFGEDKELRGAKRGKRLRRVFIGYAASMICAPGFRLEREHENAHPIL
jgi:hypothetical protein